MLNPIVRIKNANHCVLDRAKTTVLLHVETERARNIAGLYVCFIEVVIENLARSYPMYRWILTGSIWDYPFVY